MGRRARGWPSTSTSRSPTVESQRPEELPIDLTEELHIRGVDRVSIDFRRWLAEIALDR